MIIAEFFKLLNVLMINFEYDQTPLNYPQSDLTNAMAQVHRPTLIHIYCQASPYGSGCAYIGCSLN